MLASGRRAAELGTGFGEGAAAMAETARELVTVEIDPARADVARGRLEGRTNVLLLVGDWRELLPPLGPFELLFADGGLRRASEYEAALPLVAHGGLIVKDDLTPGRPVDGDPVRGSGTGTASRPVEIRRRRRRRRSWLRGSSGAEGVRQVGPPSPFDSSSPR